MTSIPSYSRDVAGQRPARAAARARDRQRTALQPGLGAPDGHGAFKLVAAQDTFEVLGVHGLPDEIV